MGLDGTETREGKLMEALSRVLRGQGRLPWLVVLSLAFLACTTYRPTTTDGRTIYREACASCHAVPPATGPNLVGMRLTPEKVAQTLDRGGKKMPAFPGIQGEARRNLIQYVVTLQSPNGN